MIYLDHNATTPLASEVLESMIPVLEGNFGNPSSIHSAGRAARVRLDEAREEVAGLIGARPGEIVFTSGGTESDNLAIKGVAWALRDRGRHIITCRAEHPAVLNACHDLQPMGFETDYLPVDRFGRLDPSRVRDCIRGDTVLITVQHANSEVGTVQDIEAIGGIARERGILFHTDAVQSAGKIPLNVAELPVDYLSFSAHKMYGPKGAGALYLRRGGPGLVPLISGGGQEKKRRAGTENVAAIAGFGKAAQLARERLESPAPARLAGLRDELFRLLENTTGVERFGDPVACLPNTLGAGFEGVSGETLLIALDLEGICVSTGSACSSGSLNPSHVLTAMGVPEDKINGSIRFSLGWNNTREEIETVAQTLGRVVSRIRRKTPARG